MKNIKRKYLPKISIITVVLNDKQGIIKTIDSVMKQTYPNTEYIIIDGGSIDGTIEKIKKYNQDIHHWISEKDKGLFDAMNKGINLASSEWMIFMNSGHIFFNENTIANVINSYKGSKYDIIYGDTVYEMTFGEVVKYNQEIKYIWKGMSFSHQSVFIKTNLCKKFKYSLDYQFASDFDLFYKLYIAGYKYNYIGEIISKRKIEGNTNSNIIKSTIERYKIVRKGNNSFRLYLYYQFQIIKYLARNITPSSFLNYYYYKRYRNRIIHYN